MNKKAIQKKRMMSYFIDATHKIIEKEGIHAVTIRKVADIAGYNSATLYNYFENLDHLIFFASMKYINDYVFDLPNYIKNSQNTLDTYLNIWECFCQYSFKSPKIYHTIFFGKFSHMIENSIEEYYSIFPEKLGEQNEDLAPMLLNQNIYQRNLYRLTTCASEGLINKEHIKEINEMTLLIYQGMLSRILNNDVNYTVDQSTKKMLKYIKQIIISYSIQNN